MFVCALPMVETMRLSSSMNKGMGMVNIPKPTPTPKSTSTPTSTSTHNPYKLNVVITGSTKGIGKALAAQYYHRGANVVINSRNIERVYSTYNELCSSMDKRSYKNNMLYGIAADVSILEEVDSMIHEITKVMPNIDIWINNAGTCSYRRQPFWKFETSDINTIVFTNVLGVMYCCKLVIPMMEQQSTGGHIINVIGAGSDGRSTPGYSVYGATKSGIKQFTKTLVDEVGKPNGLNKKQRNIGIHILSPGMVETDLIMSNVENDSGLREVLTMMCDKPDVVAAEIVEKINRQIILPKAQHTVINILTPMRIVGKIVKHNLRIFLRKFLP